MTYEEWKAELIRITSEETGTPVHEIKIRDSEGMKWYESGTHPYYCFREQWG